MADISNSDVIEYQDWLEDLEENVLITAQQKSDLDDILEGLKNAVDAMIRYRILWCYTTNLMLALANSPFRVCQHEETGGEGG